ncbi:MAG: histidine phosphatase family protein [Pseudomonadota bacterium]
MILLIRHGEAAAAWGAAPDPGLSDLGAKQARAAAARAKALGAVNAVTSPMQRCRETAAAFERHASVTARVEPAVSEIATPAAIKDRRAWLSELMAGAWAEAGDEFVDWRERAVQAVAAAPDGTAVFSHFVAINAIVGALTGRDDVVVFKPANCSITRLERRGGVLTVAELGDEAPPVVL